MKLNGIKVIDLSLFLPGPHLTMMMADHGADVICVEPPGGEPTRNFPYATGGASVWFRNTHRGKRSICLDLKTATGREALLGVCDTADVVLEAFRPGVVDRLGVGYSAVSARNPRVVYASLAAFGQTGPLAQRPAHDLAVEALAGIVSLNLGNDEQPTMPHMLVSDMAGSLMALSGILMALLRRERTGQGDYLDISMLDATLAWLPNVIGSVFAEGRPPRVKQERSFGGGSFNYIYRTGDGRHLVLGGSEVKFVERLLTKLGRPDLIPAASAPAGPEHAPVKAFLADTFATRTLNEWLDWLADLDICYAPVLNMVEAFAQPQVAAREMLVRDAQGNANLGIPIRFRGEPGRINPRLPTLGEHTAELCGIQSAGTS